VGYTYHFRKVTSPTVGFTHRTVADFLKSGSIRSQLLADAGSEPSYQLALCRSSLAALSLSAYELSDPESRGVLDANYNVRFVWKCAIDDYTKTLMYRSKSINDAAAYSLWSETKELMVLHSQPDNYPLIRLMIREDLSFIDELDLDSKFPETPTALDIAISHDAPTFMRCELKVTSLRTLSSRVGIPPLHLVVYRRQLSWLECISILLEHGADANEIYHSWTPWMLFLYRLCQRRDKCVIRETGPPTLCRDEDIRRMCSLFIKNGADLGVSCKMIALIYLNRRIITFERPRCLESIDRPHVKVHLTFSVTAILRDISFPMDTNASAEPDRAHEETPLAAYDRLAAAFSTDNSTSVG
jgi:hypothetical protein